MKNLIYIGVLIASAILYFNIHSVIFYVIAIIITVVLFYYDLKLINKFKQLSLWKKAFAVAGILVSTLIVLVFYFIAHGYQNICTVGQGVRAKNYFTGEYKEFYCGITPWYYYEKVMGKDNFQFPVVKKEVVVTPTTPLTTDNIYEIGKTYKMTWVNNSGKTPIVIAVETLSKDGQSLGYHNIATSSISSAKTGAIDINITTWFLPKYDYKLVVFGNNREVIYKSSESFTVVDNRSFTLLVAGGNDIKINKNLIFEFGKPFTLSNGTIYSSGIELTKNFAQVSIVKFSEDACEVLSASDASICNFKGEQAVTLKITAVMGDSTSYWTTTRQKSLTPIGAKITRLERTGNNYEIELISMDIQKNQATIIVRPVNI